MTIVARPNMFAETPTFAHATLVLPFCATIHMSGSDAMSASPVSHPCFWQSNPSLRLRLSARMPLEHASRNSSPDSSTDYNWAVTDFCLELAALPPLKLFKRRAIILGAKIHSDSSGGRRCPFPTAASPLPFRKGHTSKKAFTLKQRMHLPTSINQQARLFGWTVKLREKQKWPRSRVGSLLSYLAASWQLGFVPWANVGVGANMLHSFVHVNVHNACFPPFMCMQG